MVAMLATAFGLFAGIPLLIWFVSVTIVNVGTLMILIFLCGAVGLLQWRYVKDHLELAYHQFAMFSFSGFAMCLLNLLFLLNMIISIHERKETYEVEKFITSDYNGDFAVSLNDPALARNLKNFIDGHFHEMPDGKRITIIYNTGLLGFDRICDVRFTDR